MSKIKEFLRNTQRWSFITVLYKRRLRVIVNQSILQYVSEVPLAGHIEGVKAEKGPPLHGAVSASPSGLSPPKRPTDERCRPSSFNKVFRVKFE